MPTYFKNAPLIEIIVELGWPIDRSFGNNQFVGGTPILLSDTNGHEAFFMRFGGEVFQHGFQASERIVPPGFPILPNQTIFRYRNAHKSELYQVGPGVFTANVVPPYRAWHEFMPIVSNGVSALLRSRNEAEKASPFDKISLRYVNAFNAEHRDGKSPQEFMNSTLHMRPSVPDVMLKHLGSADGQRFVTQASLPLKNSMILSYSLGEGVAAGVSALILDISVTASGVPPEHGKLMESLGAAHGIIHEIFFDLTKPIREILRPEEI